jgi:phosphatidylglycerol lysyltransferase
MDSLPIPPPPGIAVTWRRLLWEAIKREWPVWLTCFVILANGLLPVFQTLLTRFREHPLLFNTVLPFGVFHFSRSLTVAIGFVLVYLSFRLLQRRRVAWWLAIVSLSLSLIMHLVFQLWFEALAPAVALALLVIFRNRFSVRTERHSITRGLELSIFVVVFAVVYGIVGFSFLDYSDFGFDFSFGEALYRTLRQLFFVGNSDLVTHSRYARWFLDSLYLMGALALGFVAYSIFRPVVYRLQVVPREMAEAKAILAKYGRSSYDYFKVWPDKSYFFSGTRNSFISYKVVRSVAFSLADPIGPEDELENTARAFLRFCSDNGWLVAFLIPDILPMYERLGLSKLKIGKEAIVDLDHFSSNTINTKYFRKIRRRFETRGYKLVRYKPPHSATLLDEVGEISKQWLSEPGRHEFGFMQGSFTRGYVAEVPLVVLRDSTGRPLAFVNEIPSYRPGEGNFDMMRHVPGVPPGSMDYIFTELMLALKQEGYRSFDLGLAPFAGVGERPEAPMGERAVHLLFNTLFWFVSYKGMRNYKVKFEPNWEDRFIVYQGGPIGLVRTALAIGRALEG